MGVIKFVHRFVPDFAVMFKPIHNILKKDCSFSWTNDVRKFFHRDQERNQFRTSFGEARF
jgi:hypothetical protein